MCKIDFWNVATIPLSQLNGESQTKIHAGVKPLGCQDSAK